MNLNERMSERVEPRNPPHPPPDSLLIFFCSTYSVNTSFSTEVTNWIYSGIFVVPRAFKANHKCNVRNTLEGIWYKLIKFMGFKRTSGVVYC